MIKKSTQMYKIYVNETPLCLVSRDALKFPITADSENIVAPYPGNAKFLLHYIDMLEKSRRFNSVTLYSEDLEKLKSDFEGHFRIVEAAGGLVLNRKSEVLFIFRRGSWDLPKGKVDQGESIEAAAIREVKEETGLEEVTLLKPLSLTYHTYREASGVRILKRTYWFLMTTENTDLTPQQEEDIEQAVWMSVPEFLAGKRTVYGNIRNLLKKI